MATINMHMKFEIEIPKQTWLMLRKPCRLQTDGQTDRRTRWIQYTPPPTSLGGGINKVNPVYPPSNFIGRGYKYDLMEQFNSNALFITNLWKIYLNTILLKGIAICSVTDPYIFEGDFSTIHIY